MTWKQVILAILIGCFVVFVVSYISDLKHRNHWWQEVSPFDVEHMIYSANQNPLLENNLKNALSDNVITNREKQRFEELEMQIALEEFNGKTRK